MIRDPDLFAAFNAARAAWEQRQDQLTLEEIVQSDCQRDGVRATPSVVPPAPKETT